MSIWFKKDISIEDFESWPRNTLAEHLGMRFAEVGDNYIKISMPVEDRTRQPYGLLHGGASVALAETAGTYASALVVDSSRFICLGMEVNANHIRSVKEGIVTAICSPHHLGKSSHVWDIKIYNEENQLVCISRLTVTILPNQHKFKVKE